ncbi:MAG: T9SS type A sorting domain-containing protein [Candidatus Eisenbacteria bacterium]
MKNRVLILSALLLILVSGVAAAQIQTTVYAIREAQFPELTLVSVDSVVVTAIDKVSTYGFWVQEKAGGPHAGIMVYPGSVHYNYFGALRPGIIVNVTGLYDLYGGTDTSTAGAEITYSPLSWTIIDSMDVPEPLLFSCQTVGILPTDADTSEVWESMLVRLDTVKVVRHDPTFASSYFLIEDHNHPLSTNKDTVYVRNNKMTSPGPARPDLNTVMPSITGILHFENGRYHICPRDADDLVFEAPPNFTLAYATSNTGVQAVFDRRVDLTTAQNTGNYYLGSETVISGAVLDPIGEQLVTLTVGDCSAIAGDPEILTVQSVKSKGGTVMPAAQQQSFRAGLTPIQLVQAPKSAENDSSQMTTEQVTIAGIVTADPDTFITHFYMEQTPGGPWSGIQIYGGLPVAVNEGDSLIISGYVSEYFYKTEITGIDYVRVVNTGNPVPGPDIVDPSQINKRTNNAEQYEGVYVKIQTVQVCDTTGFDLFGEWRVRDATPDTMLIAHSGGYTVIPKPFYWYDVRGPIDYAYNNFRIEPRRNDDIVQLPIGVDPGPTVPLVFALEKNFPNPFNPLTTIFFTIPERTDVDLCVYDVSGRLVKTLIGGVGMDPGGHNATWDGRNNAGRVVSSGVYFCKLVAGDKFAETKMVMLK